MRPRLYLETTIPSYLAARPSRDVLVLARQEITRRWWREEKQNYELLTSSAVVEECSDGEPAMAKLRLSYLEGTERLEPTVADSIAQAILGKVSIPKHAAYDAVHIAVAAYYHVDYILTWNFKHLANARMWPGIQKVCDSFGLLMPVICSPEQLLGDDDDGLDP